MQQVLYGGVKSVGNPLFPGLMAARLGDDPGFGWQDMTTVKGGLQWRSNDDWIEDAGKWAFMKNMGMPGSIQDELRGQIRDATGQQR